MGCLRQKTQTKEEGSPPNRRTFLFTISDYLIILHPKLEIRLRVQTGRALVRRVFSIHHIAAIAADPIRLLLSLEHSACFDVGEQFEIPLLVVRLNSADALHLQGDVVKALFLGHGGEVFVHGGVLVVFTGGGVFEVLDGVIHAA